MNYILLLFFVGLFVKFSKCADEAELDRLTSYIQAEIQKAQSFVLPTDSKSYKPQGRKNEIPKRATGCVLANRLSENENWKVLLLEAGDYGNNFTEMPAMIYLSHYTKFNWGYESVPQKYSCLGMEHSKCQYPRGLAMGGTTLINGMINVRGNPLDFDRWAELGNPGWSYDEVLPYFLKTEHMNKNNPDAVVDYTYHNTSGILNQEFHTESNPQIRAFYEANQELGYNFTDVNSRDQIGFTPVPLNMNNGKRIDAATAFIKPILTRKNLVVVTNALVTKIDIHKERKNALGVFFSKGGKNYYAKVKKEVIVSAGAINSPQLLMLSGIGPHKHLKKHHIHVIQNLEVGSVFLEHPMMFGLNFETNYTEPILEFKEYVREYLNGTGILTAAGGIQAIGFYTTKLSQEKNNPDLEILFASSNCTDAFAKVDFKWTDETWNATYRDLNPATCIFMYPIVLHAKSSGSIRLKSNNPYEYPLINPNHLSDTNRSDIETIFQGVKFIFELANTTAFKKINTTFFGTPLPACSNYTFLTDDYLYCAIGQLTYNVFHPVGSCPMGPDPKLGAVVNKNLRVYGIKQLRVADASVFPFTFAGHPVAPCNMVGEKLADILKELYK